MNEVEEVKEIISYDILANTVLMCIEILEEELENENMDKNEIQKIVNILKELPL